MGHSALHFWAALLLSGLPWLSPNQLLFLVVTKLLCKNRSDVENKGREESEQKLNVLITGGPRTSA